MERVRLRHVSLAICGGLLLGSALAAQAPPAEGEGVLTLEDCIRKALAAPSQVSLARRGRAIAARGQGIAQAAFLPHSMAAAGSTYNSPWQQNREVMSFVALNGIREYTGLASVFQEIDTSGRLRAEYARARAEQNAAAASLALAERDLKRAVGSAYYRVLLTRRLAGAFRDLLRESEAFEARVKLLAAAGEAAQADVVKASSQSAFFRQGVLATDLAAALANQELASFWTTAVAVPLRVADTLDEPLPEPEPAAPEPAPYLGRPEFRLFEAQERGLVSQARAERAVLLPQLRWSFQYGLDANRVAWNHRGHALFASLQMPVFDWFRARNTARQFDLQAEQVRDRRMIAERGFSQEYSSALERVRQIFAQVEVCRSQAELAAEDLRLSRLRFEGGEGPAIDVVVAQNQLAQARSNYYSSIANYMNARLDLEVAAGR